MHDYSYGYCLLVPTIYQVFDILSLAKFSQQPYELVISLERVSSFIHSFIHSKMLIELPPDVQSFLGAKANTLVSRSLQSSGEE